MAEYTAARAPQRLARAPRPMPLAPRPAHAAPRLPSPPLPSTPLTRAQTGVFIPEKSNIWRDCCDGMVDWVKEHVMEVRGV
jgi:hypothetical protein